MMMPMGTTLVQRTVLAVIQLRLFVQWLAFVDAGTVMWIVRVVFVLSTSY